MQAPSNAIVLVASIIERTSFDPDEHNQEIAPKLALVAEIDTAVASSSLITLWRGTPLLAFSVTLPQYQNNGLGGHLISRSAELLRDEGYRELRLVVTRANPAITLYRRLGFVNDDHRPG